MVDKKIFNAPPALISCLASGFNTVATHLYLLLFPILLDLFLWLGPHFRVLNLVKPIIADISQSAMEASTPEIMEMLRTSEQVWTITLERFNLISLARTFPIGIPSLLTFTAPLDTPVGKATVQELSSFPVLLFFWLGILVCGLFFGTLYFDFVAQTSGNIKRSQNLKALFKLFLHSVGLSIGFFVLILAIAIPVMLVITILGLFSPNLAQIVFMLILLVLLWIIIPLFFAPHGIFLFQQNAYTATLASIRTVRYTLPATSLFLLIFVVFNQGLNIIWSMAPGHSWMTLIGITGHAFISTGLLSSSFILYLRLTEWTKSLQKQQSISTAQV